MKDNISIKLPGYKSKLEVCKGFTIEFKNKMPNWWIRLWHRLFFGFKWEDVK